MDVTGIVQSTFGVRTKEIKLNCQRFNTSKFSASYKKNFK